MPHAGRASVLASLNDLAAPEFASWIHPVEADAADVSVVALRDDEITERVGVDCAHAGHLGHIWIGVEPLPVADPFDRGARPVHPAMNETSGIHIPDAVADIAASIVFGNEEAAIGYEPDAAWQGEGCLQSARTLDRNALRAIPRNGS